MTQLITKIEIENLRGVARGELDGLAPLTILTGPNGCGKSTVLDALLIVANPFPGEGIGRAIERHPAVPEGARWLVRRDGEEEVAHLRISTTDADGLARTVDECWLGGPREQGRSDVLAISYHADEELGVTAARGNVFRRFVLNQHPARTTTEFTQNGWGVRSLDATPSRARSPVRLIDPGIPKSVVEAYSDAVRAGQRARIESYLPAIAVGAESLVLLTDAGKPSLYLEYAGAAPVPVALTGDGVYAFLQIAIELAHATEGLVLVEEPEVYQHPRALRKTALALVTAVRRGAQVVITTHSLELIDAILATLEESELDKLAFFSLALDNGLLKSTRYSGKDGAFARESIDRDLR